MKKSDNTRSHSWWWDSHISPKNSKWLQENLSEMDTKVNAMLKIIEEDADSFAQRAEMYYKKRPELINLVEEFYRTYRALVERYTFLTREIRQNIAPALQAQLGVASESPQNSPLKRGLDGPDIISPSYSYAGASEFDYYDSPTSTKGHTDEDELSPLGFTTSYETRPFGFKPKFSNLENTSRASESGHFQDVDITQLQKDILHLQEENKVLASKSAEDATKIKSLQLDLSSFQSKMRSLEAEDKLTRKRLQSIQEQEQKLQAENLKLSHALITLKEERTDLVEHYNKTIQESNAACQRNQLLEDQMVALKQDMLAVQAQDLEQLEHIKQGEEANQMLQQAFASLEEQRMMDAKTFEQQSQELHKKISDTEEESARLKEKTLAVIAEVKSLQDQLADAIRDNEISRQLLLVCKQEMILSEHEKSVATSKVLELQRELGVAQKERQGLSDQMMQQVGEIASLKKANSKLKEESTKFEAEIMEGAKYVHKLEADIEEIHRATETLGMSSKHYQDRCIALELAETELKEKLLSSSEEIAQLQNQCAAFENMTASARFREEELQKSLSSLLLEKAVLMEKLEKSSQHVKVSEGECAKMHQVARTQLEEMKKLEQELSAHLADIERLANSFSHVSKEKDALMERQTETLQVCHQLENERTQLKEELEVNRALRNDLKDQISHLEKERSELVLESQKMQGNTLELQDENSLLFNQLVRYKEYHQAAEEAARKAQEDVALSLSEVQKLKEQGVAKTELIQKAMLNLELLETQFAKSREEKSLLQEVTEKYSKKLSEFEVQTHELHTKLSVSLFENAALAKQVSEKAEHIELLDCKLSDSHSKAAALNEEIELKTSYALGLRHQVHSLTQQLELLHAELHKNCEAKQNLEKILEEVRQRQSEAKDANQILVDEQQRLFHDILVLKKNNQQLEGTLSNLTDEKMSLLDEVSTLSEECKDMKKTFEDLESVYEANMEALKQQLKKSEDEINVLEAESLKKLFEAEGRVQELQLRVSKMLVENVSLADQVSERMRNIQILETQVFDLHNDNSYLNENVRKLQQQFSVLKDQEASLLVDKHKTSVMTETLKAEVERLHQVVFEAEEANKILAHEQERSLDECLVMRKTIANLQEDLGLLAEEKFLLIKGIATHSGRSNELELEVKRLKTEKGLLQQDLAVALQVEGQLKEDVKNLLKEKTQLSGILVGILHSHKVKMQKQEEDFQSLQRALSDTKQEQGTIMDKLSLLTEEKGMLERSHVALQEELRESRQEASRARHDFLKLETDLSQLQQAKVTFEALLSTKTEVIQKLQEDFLILEATKSEFEQKLQVGTKQIIAHEEEVKMLTEMLGLVPQDKGRLQSMTDWQVTYTSPTGVSKDRDKQIEDSHILKDSQILKQGVTEVVKIRRNLEKQLAELQEDKTTHNQVMDEMQQKLLSLQEELEQSSVNLQAALLQGHERDIKMSYLQEQLISAESCKLERAEKQSKISDEWKAVEKRFLEEIAHLKSMNLQEKSNLNVQQGRLMQLEDEVSDLQAERMALQDDKALNMSKVMELQQQIEGMTVQLSEKYEEVSKLSAQVTCLQQTLSSMEVESATLKEILQKDRDCYSASKKIFSDKLSLAQSEVESKAGHEKELHDKCALEGTNRALLEEIFMKEILCFERQKEIESLEVENKELTWKLQIDAAQIAELCELHGNLLKLQDENKSINISCRGLSEEKALLGEEIRNLIDAHSTLQEENIQLKSKLAANKCAGFSNMELEILLPKEHGEAFSRTGLDEGQAIGSDPLLAEVKETTELKREADMSTEKLSKLQTLRPQEQGKSDASVTELDLLQKGLSVVKEENRKPAEMVCDGAHTVRKLQAELCDSNQDLQGQLKDSQVMLNNVEKLKEASLYELHRHRHGFLLMMSEIDNLEKILGSDQASIPSAKMHEGLMPKRQVSHLQAGISSLEQASLSLSSNITDDKLMMMQKELGSPPEMLPSHDTNQQSDALEVMKMIYASGMLHAKIDVIHLIKEKVLMLLEENDSLKRQSVAELVEHQVLENSVEDLQERLSHLQQENGSLTLEVYLYGKEVHQLEKTLEGEEFHNEGEFVHETVKRLQRMLYNLQERTTHSQEENRGLHEEVEILKMKARNLELMLLNLQEKGSTFSLLLKKNIIATCDRIKSIAEEWQKEKGSCKVMDCIEKLNELQKLSTTIEDEKVMPSLEESSLEELDKQSLHQPEAANTLVLQQLKRRAEEIVLLREAVENLSIATDCRQEQCKEGYDILLSTSTTKEEVAIMEENGLHHHKELDLAAEGEGVKGYNLDLQDHEQIELIDPCLHINLGMRLHQTLMDEKLENELLELKEERKQLKEDLQARVEQVQRMEAELEKLQSLIVGGLGREEDEEASADRVQWLTKKRKAEETARKLSEDLVQQRQQVGNMQEVVITWTEEQEVATEILEEQVLFLVSQEIAPTMEGWDAEKVSQLMQDMQTRKALARRHSMELQSVGQELERVGSSIESTQRQLLHQDQLADQLLIFMQQDELADQGDVQSEGHHHYGAGGSFNDISNDMNINDTRRKLARRYGLTRFLLLFSRSDQERSKSRMKGLFRRRRRRSSPLAGMQVAHMNYTPTKLVGRCCACACRPASTSTAGRRHHHR